MKVIKKFKSYDPFANPGKYLSEVYHAKSKIWF